MAKERGYGVLLVETDNEDVTNVREHREPEVKEAGKGTVVSNSSQRSPGNFRKEVQGIKGVPQLPGTLILKNVMTDPKEFYENEMKPLKERYEERQKRDKAIRKDPTGTLDEIIEFLEEIDTAELSISEDSVRMEKADKMVLMINILTDKIKILDSDENLLFRIMDDSTIEIFDDAIGDLQGVDDVTQTLGNRLTEA